MLSATDNGFVWVLLSIFIPSQIAVMILMSKFSKADGVVDVLDDRIGKPHKMGIRHSPLSTNI